MRVRLSLRWMSRGIFVVGIFLFTLFLLMNHLDTQENKRARDIVHQKKVDHAEPPKDFEPPAKDNNLRFGGLGQDLEEQPRQERQDKLMQDQAPVPGHLEQDANFEVPIAPGKQFGPKSHFTKNQIGNYEPTHLKPYPGPGEGGEPVYASMNEKSKADQSVREYGFNMVVSDKIAMLRNIPDTRHHECKNWQYPEKLPTASVIIVFHNEGWTTLMRTVHSVINMSPPQLLHEIVMVDDFSEKAHLKDQLDEYVKQFNGLVKVFRNPERLGLIRTRTLGAQYSTGDVIVFLDAHCECNKNWLPPLLARIAYDRTIMAVPLIDSIKWNTFAYSSTYTPGREARGIFEWGFLYKESRVPRKERRRRAHVSEPYRTIMAVPIIDGIDWNNFRYNPVYQAGHNFRGIFEWGFLYKESAVPTKVLNEREYDSEPYKSPTHAGGLFAMDRKYFFELGAYDEGLMIWGGENFELSFKIWQCGGSIEWVPCSRVGHVYRNHMPYGFGKLSPKIPIILLNYMRVVEVWLDDEFKEYFYTREPTIRGYPIGNITKQLQFKKDHKCKSFKWFMDNIAYEVYEKFPPPPPNKGWGEIKLKTGTLCWDSMGQSVGGGPIGLSHCHHFGGNQLWRLNVEGQLAVGERCLDWTGNGISIIFCPVQPKGPWSLEDGTGLMRHRQKDKCITAEGNKLVLRTCDPNNADQQWEINPIKTW